MRCQHFRIMFQEHWAENNQSVIEHEHLSYDVYRAFFNYLYMDEINVPIEDALEFLDLTNAYSESQLQSHWTQLIKKDITVRNVIPLYNAAILYNAKELEEYCFQFAVNHLTAVVRRPSFSKLRSVSNILAGELVFANSDQGEISHHHLTIVDLSVGIAWPSQGMVG